MVFHLDANEPLLKVLQLQLCSREVIIRMTEVIIVPVIATTRVPPVTTTACLGSQNGYEIIWPRNKASYCWGISNHFANLTFKLLILIT